MKTLQTRFVQFAADIFKQSAPLMSNNFLEPRVKKLISSSSRLGASIYQAQASLDDYEFASKIRSSFIELQETQYWIQILMNAKPDHLQLILLEQEAKNLLELLDDMLEKKEAV